MIRNTLIAAPDIRFTTRLDVTKLNMMLSSGSLETGTGSSNSLRSGNESCANRDS